MQSTPMLTQYHAIKNRHKNCILLFRLGDFYEMFYDDAKVASRRLDLVLTARGKPPSGKIPMCGFPYHAADQYIARLINNGHKVAICEQMEDPALAKGIVKRDVTRIITSGTFLDETSTDARYLLCLSPSPQCIGSPHGEAVGLAFCDPASGAIQTNQYSAGDSHLIGLIATLPVYECIYPESAEEHIKPLFAHPLLRTKNIVLSPHADWCFNPDMAKKSLCAHFGVHNLHGFGIEDLPAAVASAGALLEYLKEMNKQPLRHMDKITLYTDDDYVFISPAAHHGLELDCLIKTLDQTLTPLGRRQFRFWFLHPLKEPQAIRQRQEAVVLLKNNPLSEQHLKTILQKIPDLEKNISRLSCGYTHAKDLLAIRNALSLLPEIQNVIQPLKQQNPLFVLEDIPALRQLLEKAVNEQIPLSQPEGKIIRKGYDPRIDELRAIQENGRAWLKKFQEEEIRRTRINSLKVGFNQVFGYYIEITKANLSLIPQDYIRRQTLVNAERFITPELKEFEEKILTAEEKILKIEGELIGHLQKVILDHSTQLHRFCQTIAVLDVLYALARLAQGRGYVVPQITEECLLDIQEGRHPVVEKVSGENFIPNDTYLDDKDNHLIILTGPNMSGKSTYIRQTAVLTIMAQAGSFIPAQSARIGIVDKIFTRIGAHDEITKGQSTFMVEMNETADILNNLTDRSLVILDEIGRGTSTYDGLSLAWAVAEHLQRTKTRTLFATHFHELTALADAKTSVSAGGGCASGAKNYNVAVKEWKDEVIFLHKIVPGSTDDSYGIYVAKLAGIPPSVINRAKHILTQLELKNDLKENLKSGSPPEKQLDMFLTPVDPAMAVIRETIQAMDINSLTPLEALNKMQELKNLVEKD